VYLAGLGAFSQARRGGPLLLLQALIAEGARIHADARGAAEKAVRRAIGSPLVRRVPGHRSGRMPDPLQGLENVMRERVSHALTQLGLPSAKQVASLTRQIDALNTRLTSLPLSGRERSRSRRKSGRVAPSLNPLSGTNVSKA
jgi:poly(hydroxyalkanoate) granule-associated protein